MVCLCGVLGVVGVGCWVGVLCACCVLCIVCVTCCVCVSMCLCCLCVCVCVFLCVCTLSFDGPGQQNRVKMMVMGTKFHQRSRLESQMAAKWMQNRS